MKNKLSTALTVVLSATTLLIAGSALSAGADTVKRAPVKPVIKPVKALQAPQCAPGFTVINKKLDTSATPAWGYECVKQEKIITKCNTGLNKTALKIKTGVVIPVEGGASTTNVYYSYTCFPTQG
ncbi:MAG: hypothetical protein ABJN40_15200 [Sneathiella sp.]